MPLEGEKPMAGYGGFVPVCEVAVMPLKTTVSARMPLAQRVLPVQAAAAPVPKTPEPIRSYFLPKRHVGNTTYSESTLQFVRTASDVPPRGHERRLAATHEPPHFVSTTDKLEATASIVRGRRSDFFSEARKIERADDDARREATVAPTRSGAALQLRTVDIARKRESDPALVPPKESFVLPPRTLPNGIPPPSASDSVRFRHVPSLPSSQIEYTAPRGRLASLGASVQRTDPGSPRRAITDVASTGDMFEGTAKSRADLIPGFMGHVPSHSGNTDSILGPGTEILREHSKCPVRVSAAPDIDRRVTLRGRGGETVQGESNLYVVNDTVESQMNTRDGTGRKNAVRGFFSAGVSEQDSIIADQFCSRYRPLEGVMKMGPPGTRPWISDRDLFVKGSPS